MRYYIIMHEYGNNLGTIVAIVTNKLVAIDYCSKNPSCFFTEEEVSDAEEISMMGD